MTHEKIFVVWNDWDCDHWEIFDNDADAQAWCQEFWKRPKDNGLEYGLAIIRGIKIDPQTWQPVESESP